MLHRNIARWTPDNDVWELYNLEEDWSQANDLAEQMPEKVAQLKEIFIVEAAKNKVLPIGGGLYVPLFHPELRIAPPYTRVDVFRRYDARSGILRSSPRKQAERRYNRCHASGQCQRCFL